MESLTKKLLSHEFVSIWIYIVMSVNDSVTINDEQTVTVNDLDEDTDDSVAEDEDQDTVSGLDNVYEQIDSTGVERAIVLPAATKAPVDEDDDFRPVKKRKVQENNESNETDEVTNKEFQVIRLLC